MAFVTAQRLRQQVITERLEKVAKSIDDTPDVFLSHSKHDNDYVEKAAALLRHYGARVYADILDRDLDAMTLSDKCSRIRDAVKGCKKLIVLFTENTSASRWIPWELGLADGVRERYSVATFPIAQAEAESQWGTQEYFGLYPQVRWAQLQGHSAPTYVVFNPVAQKYWTLEQWLTA